MELLGTIAGILTLVGFLPQTLKAIHTRKTKDLSLATFLIIGTSAILWTTYGYNLRLPSIWITNAVVAICSAIILGIKLSQKDF